VTERGEASRIGAKLHKNSGRNNTKGDASWNQYVLDFKEFTKSFSITQNVWAKVVTDTLRVDKNKSPAICLILDGKTRLAIIEWSEFERLVENDNNT
jgi:outer membrane phospholipase A